MLNTLLLRYNFFKWTQVLPFTQWNMTWSSYDLYSRIMSKEAEFAFCVGWGVVREVQQSSSNSACSGHSLQAEIVFLFPDGLMAGSKTSSTTSSFIPEEALGRQSSVTPKGVARSLLDWQLRGTEKGLCQDFVQKENEQLLCHVRNTNLTLGHSQDELWSPWRVYICTSFGTSPGSALHSCSTQKSWCLSAAWAEQSEAGKGQEEQPLWYPSPAGSRMDNVPVLLSQGPCIACLWPQCNSMPLLRSCWIPKVSPAGPVSLNPIPLSSSPSLLLLLTCLAMHTNVGAFSMSSFDICYIWDRILEDKGKTDST